MSVLSDVVFLDGLDKAADALLREVDEGEHALAPACNEVEALAAELLRAVALHIHAVYPEIPVVLGAVFIDHALHGLAETAGIGVAFVVAEIDDAVEGFYVAAGVLLQREDHRQIHLCAAAVEPAALADVENGVEFAVMLDGVACFSHG